MPIGLAASQTGPWAFPFQNHPLRSGSQWLLEGWKVDQIKMKKFGRDKNRGFILAWLSSQNMFF